MNTQNIDKECVAPARVQLNVLGKEIESITLTYFDMPYFYSREVSHFPVFL